MTARDESTDSVACDDFLIARSLEGDAESFRLLVRRYERQVLGMGLSFLHNRADAEDFAQDVFVKVFRNLDAFEKRARFSTWLYRIAYRTALNMKERRKEYVSLAETGGEGGVACGGGGTKEAPTPMRTPEDEAIRGAVREAVREAVADLPERYRICVDLYFFYERTFREIERITGFPENTAKSHVARAKKILRRKLAAYGHV